MNDQPSVSVALERFEFAVRAEEEATRVLEECKRSVQRYRDELVEVIGDTIKRRVEEKAKAVGG